MIPIIEHLQQSNNIINSSLLLQSSDESDILLLTNLINDISENISKLKTRQKDIQNIQQNMYQSFTEDEWDQEIDQQYKDQWNFIEHNFLKKNQDILQLCQELHYGYQFKITQLNNLSQKNTIYINPLTLKFIIPDMLQQMNINLKFLYSIKHDLLHHLPKKRIDYIPNEDFMISLAIILIQNPNLIDNQTLCNIFIDNKHHLRFYDFYRFICYSFLIRKFRQLNFEEEYQKVYQTLGLILQSNNNIKINLDQYIEYLCQNQSSNINIYQEFV